MSVLLEHHDVEKARRAMLATAVIVIALEYVTLSSNVIEIFKLKVDVSLPKLIFAGKISIAYLTFVFLWRASISIAEKRRENWDETTIEGVEDLKSNVHRVIGDMVSPIRFRAEFQRSKVDGDENLYLRAIFDEALTPLFQKFSWFQYNQITSRAYVVDVYVPVAISLLALTSLHQLVIPIFLSQD